MTLEPGLKQGSPLIHYEPAYTVDFLAVTKKSHAYAKAKSFGLRELARHALVVTTVGTHGRRRLPCVCLDSESPRSQGAQDTQVELAAIHFCLHQELRLTRILFCDILSKYCYMQVFLLQSVLTTKFIYD